MNYSPQSNTTTLQRTNAMEEGNHFQGTNLFEKIGGHEFLSSKLWRLAFVEMVATGLLMFSLIASIIASSDGTEPSLLVPLAVFINVFLIVMAVAPISGGHLNPVISITAALHGFMTFLSSLVYITAQCIGAVLGFLLIDIVIGKEIEEMHLLGGCSLNGNGETRGIIPSQALVMEFVCTLLMLFVGLTVAFDEKRSKELGLAWITFMVSASMSVGVFISITITGKEGYAGVGLNPARCLAPALIRGGSLWHGHWVSWAGPILACMVYRAITLTFPKKPSEVVDLEDVR